MSDPLSPFTNEALLVTLENDRQNNDWQPRLLKLNPSEILCLIVVATFLCVDHDVGLLVIVVVCVLLAAP